ncbi:MAG: NHL repeat-containing protein [Chloroherpetonaceae bacterium]|nr:NHL repeat-containing protein [Chloroherpetonaceae bacterium]
MKNNFGIYFLLACIFTLMQNSVLFKHATQKEKYRPVQTFSNARALAISISLGEIFIIDEGNSTLVKLSKSGEFIASVGGFGIDREALDSPVDLVTDGMNVFVADRGNQRVAHFDRYLNFIATLQNAPTLQDNFSSSGSQQTLWRPIGVTLSPQGDLYILDEAQRQVIRINPFTFNTQERGLTAIQAFGNYNSGIGILQDPFRIQCSQTGKVFVSDVVKRKVLVFDLFGNYVTEIGDSLKLQPKSLGLGSVAALSDGSGDEKLLVLSSSGIHIYSTNQVYGFRQEGFISSSSLRELTNSEEAEDALIAFDKLYLLTKRSLYLIPLDQLPLNLSVR